MQLHRPNSQEPAAPIEDFFPWSPAPRVGEARRASGAARLRLRQGEARVRVSFAQRPKKQNIPANARFLFYGPAPERFGYSPHRTIGLPHSLSAREPGFPN